MNLPLRFLGDLIESAADRAHLSTNRSAVVSAMNKAFAAEFGRPAWNQLDVGLGRCDQATRDLDVEVWNRALVKARDANYRPENLA